MDVPRRAAELIANLDAQLGAVTMVPIPEGDTAVNILVVVKSVDADGDVNLRFGHSPNMTWLDVESLLVVGPRMMDRNVLAAIIDRKLGGDDLDGFLRGLGLKP